MAGEMAKRMAYDGNECVIIVTWEDSIEEYGLSNIANHTGIDVQDILRGRFDDTSMRQAVVELGARPVYVVGHSEETRRNRPNLSMSNVAQALIEFERTQKLKIKAVFLDYLQRMERDTDIRETRHQYMANAEASKDLALALNTHVVLGVQAGEDVAKRQMKIPQMGDAHEAPSAVRHVSNNMIGLWRPWATGDREGSVSVGGCAYACTPDLLFAQSVKQKMGDIGNTVALSVDFAQNKVVGEYTKG
jgi:replicative DNA helicase